MIKKYITLLTVLCFTNTSYSSNPPTEDIPSYHFEMFPQLEEALVDFKYESNEILRTNSRQRLTDLTIMHFNKTFEYYKKLDGELPEQCRIIKRDSFPVLDLMTKNSPGLQVESDQIKPKLFENNEFHIDQLRHIALGSLYYHFRLFFHDLITQEGPKTYEKFDNYKQIKGQKIEENRLDELLEIYSQAADEKALEYFKKQIGISPVYFLIKAPQHIKYGPEITIKNPKIFNPESTKRRQLFCALRALQISRAQVDFEKKIGITQLTETDLAQHPHVSNLLKKLNTQEKRIAKLEADNRLIKEEKNRAVTKEQKKNQELRKKLKEKNAESQKSKAENDKLRKNAGEVMSLQNKMVSDRRETLAELAILKQKFFALMNETEQHGENLKKQDDQVLELTQCHDLGALIEKYLSQKNTINGMRTATLLQTEELRKAREALEFQKGYVNALAPALQQKTEEVDQLKEDNRKLAMRMALIQLTPQIAYAPNPIADQVASLNIVLNHQLQQERQARQAADQRIRELEAQLAKSRTAEGAQATE